MALGVWSPAAAFTIQVKPIMPVVTSPAYDQTPTITWQASNFDVKYELWIGDQSGHEVFRRANIVETSFTIPTALAPGKYTVSLRAKATE